MRQLKRNALAGVVMLALVASCSESTTLPAGTPAQHTFIYVRPSGAPQLSSVNLAGSFNEWSTTARPMTQQANGTWSVTVALAAGTHQYKYVMNGSTWVQNMCNDPTWGDPAKGGKVDPDVATCASDGFGGQNGVLVVP